MGGVAGVVVLVSYRSYFAANLFAPVAKVYVATIKAGATPGAARQLLTWALPGALLQLIGGPRRQLGVLFATGMLIVFPAAGADKGSPAAGGRRSTSGNQPS